jgi:uncharacterized protein (TIGR03118 family)
MKKVTYAMRVMLRIALLYSTTTLLLTSCQKLDKAGPVLKNFEQVNLVDNNGEYNAPHTDPQLINAWGLTFTPNGIAWVNSESGHVSAVYDKEGGTIRPPVAIPSPTGADDGHPTGVVFNGTTGFALTAGGPARFIFVGVDGILSGWNPDHGNNAEVIQDNSATSVYTGLTMATVEGEPYLYASDFRANKIVVWDKNFATLDWSFTDPGIPAGFAPFNIQKVGDWLYVMYAKVGTDGEEEPGDGLGYVSVFMLNGQFVKRFASQGALNAPWGVASAPASFFKNVDQGWVNMEKGKSELPSDLHLILVGNFGNGYINAFTEDGFFLGPLKSHGKPIEIEGLWAISFPPATATAIDPDRLYFAAGPDDEEEGLFGYIIKK